MEILFLDDDPYRQAFFRSKVPYATIVDNANDCIEQLKKQRWDEVFLDHDLGGEIYQDPNEKNSGSEVVRFIVDNGPIIGKIVVHSMNQPARNKMARDLIDAGYSTRAIPFIRLKELL